MLEDLDQMEPDAPEPAAFECRDKAKGGCEGKMRLGRFKGVYCTKHLNLRADELGVYQVSDGPAEQGTDDWSRRHPKPRPSRRAR